MLHDRSPFPSHRLALRSGVPSTVSAFAACRREGFAKAVSRARTGCPGTARVASSSFCAAWANLRISCSESDAASSRDRERDLLSGIQAASETSPARALRASKPTCAEPERRQEAHVARLNIHTGTSRSLSNRRPVRLRRNIASPGLSITEWT
jgi:hypothetical protein